MTKEEFKLLILNEIKINYKNFLPLLYEPGHARWEGNNRFGEEYDYFCSEFKLAFRLSLDFVDNDSNADYFGEIKVNFRDIDDENFNWKSVEKSDMSSRYFMPLPILKEIVTLTHESAIFILQYYEIISKDYRLERKDANDLRYLVYDLKTKTFLDCNPNRDMKLMNQMRESSEYSLYLDVNPTGIDWSYFQKTPYWSSEEMAKFREFVKTLKYTDDKSSMVNMIDYLNNMK